jgi:hypothetical protein
VSGDPCLNCGMPFDEVRFPRSRPRKDGTPTHKSYCDTCLALPSRTGGGTEAHRRAARDYQRRRRAQERGLPKLTVGPLTVDRLRELGLAPKPTPRGLRR